MSISIVHTPRTSSGAKPARPWLAVLALSAKYRIVRIGERIRESRRRRRDAATLLSLDDRMLSDIGMHRSQVEYAVRYGRRRDPR